jgi:DNA-binding NtrC family response regulator
MDRVTSQPVAMTDAIARGTETILLVEDERGVRSLLSSMLEAEGYTVVEASSGEDAMAISSSYEETIHAMVSDVIMPGLTGPELQKRLAPARPGMKVLFMSGYTDDAVVRHGILREGIAYLQKPFTPASLATKVRRVLGTAPKSRAASILVIDDHDDLRESLCRLLEEAGHRVQNAEDGESGVRKLGETAFDVVITDLFMPGQDGIVTIRRIRKEYPAVKIIAMSGGGFGGHLNLLKDAVLLGAATALRKPFTQAQLLEALGVVLK